MKVGAATAAAATASAGAFSPVLASLSLMRRECPMQWSGLILRHSRGVRGIVAGGADPGNKLGARIFRWEGFIQDRYAQECAKRCPTLADLIDQEPFRCDGSNNVLGMTAEIV